MIIDSGFKWSVAAEYGVVDRADETGSHAKRRAPTILDVAPSGPYLVARGALTIKQPFKLGAGVGQKLLQGCETFGIREGVLRFAKRYGMITAASNPGDSEPL